jgi:uncharacterized protein YjbI with pentapeptide repeats
MDEHNSQKPLEEMPGAGRAADPILSLANTSPSTCTSVIWSACRVSANRVHGCGGPRWFPCPLNVVRVDLKGQWLARVNLCHASAHLANLEGATPQGATLQDADLQGANLREVKDLTPAQLQAAQTDAFTRLPDGFRIPPP